MEIKNLIIDVSFCNDINEINTLLKELEFRDIQVEGLSMNEDMFNLLTKGLDLTSIKYKMNVAKVKEFELLGYKVKKIYDKNDSN